MKSQANTPGAAPLKVPTATEVAMKVYKEKGFFGFYKGGAATLTRDVFFSAIYFPLFAFFNSKVIKRSFFKSQNWLIKYL